MTSAELEAIWRDNPWLAALLRRYDRIALPDCWIVAGALAQTVWNHRFGLSPTTGISDIDIVYFDPDLSAEAESAAVVRLRAEFAELPVWLDVKNQARVHLWYETRFGKPIQPYGSTAEAIATYPTTATAIGVRPAAEGIELCAPFGTSDLVDCRVRANPVLVSAAVYRAKAARWQAVWPGLAVLPWPGE